jgi:hypothetical protein
VTQLEIQPLPVVRAKLASRLTDGTLARVAGIRHDDEHDQFSAE